MKNDTLNDAEVVVKMKGKHLRRPPALVVHELRNRTNYPLSTDRPDDTDTLRETEVILRAVYDTI